MYLYDSIARNVRVTTVNTALCQVFTFLCQLNVILEYCGIWSGQSGKVTVFSRNNSVLPYIHHFTNAPYPFIYLPQTLHDRCKWEWCWEAHLKRRTLNVSHHFVLLHTESHGVRSKDSCISISTFSRTLNIWRKTVQFPLFAACCPVMWLSASLVC